MSLKRPLTYVRNVIVHQRMKLQGLHFDLNKYINSLPLDV